MKKLVLLIALLLIPCRAWAVDYCASAAGCWLFKDGSGTTVEDSSPNSNTGTFKGSGEPAWNTTDVSFHVSGSAPNSVDFDGNNDYINAGSDASVDNLAKESFTSYVFLDDVAIRVFFDKSTVSYLNNSLFIDSGNNGILKFQRSASSSLQVASAANTLTTSSWIHIALSWDGVTNDYSGTHLYVNAVEVSYGSRSNGSGTRADDSANSLYLGVGGNSTSFPLNGKMTDIGFFSDNLTSVQISDIYDNGLSPASGPSIHTTIIRNAVIRNAVIR